MYDQPLILGSYQINRSKVIGRGQQGEVFECTNISTGKVLCAKISQVTNEVEKENQVLQSLKQLGEERAFENLVKVYDIFNYSAYTVQILEKCDFDFEKLMLEKSNSGTWFSPEEQLDLMQQIVNGYIFLEKIRVIHRDLKPSNILVKQENSRLILKIADFGTSKCVKNSVASTTVGTPFYQAPELFENVVYDSRCDIYSFALISFQIAFGQKHRDIKTFKKLMEFIEELKVHPFKCPEPPFGTYSDVIRIIEECMKYKASTRPTWDQIYLQLSELSQEIQRNQNNQPDEIKRLITANSNSIYIKPYIIYLDRSLGQGAQSTIYLGEKLPEHTQIAAKRIPSETRDKNLLSELAISQQMKGMAIQSQFVVSVLDVVEYSDYKYILLEKCESSFTQYVQDKNGTLSLDEALDFVNQVVRGYLHLIKLQIIHRDIKPDNILVKINPDDRKPIYKISDFGAAKRSSSMSSTNIGTPLFQAPEIFNGTPYDNKCDVYSLGFILYRLVFNKYPNDLHDNSSQRELCNFIQLLQSGQFRIQYHQNQELVNLLQQMLSFNPQQRPSWEDLNQNPLIQNYQAIMAKPPLRVQIQNNNNPRIQIIQPQRQTMAKIVIPYNKPINPTPPNPGLISGQILGQGQFQLHTCGRLTFPQGYGPLSSQILPQPPLIVPQPLLPPQPALPQPGFTLKDYFKAFLDLSSLALAKLEDSSYGLKTSNDYRPYICFTLTEFQRRLHYFLQSKVSFQYKNSERKIEGEYDLDPRDSLQQKRQNYYNQIAGNDYQLSSMINSLYQLPSTDLSQYYLPCQIAIDRGILKNYNDQMIQNLESTDSAHMFYILRFRFLDQAFPIEQYSQHKPTEIVSKIIAGEEKKLGFIKQWFPRRQH